MLLIAYGWSQGPLSPAYVPRLAWITNLTGGLGWENSTLMDAGHGRRQLNERRTVERESSLGWFGLVLFLAFSGLLLPKSSVAQETPEGLLDAAKFIYVGEETSKEDLLLVRALLDRIIEVDPSSDLAVSILLGETIDGLDVAEVDRRLATTGTAETPDNSIEAAVAALDSQDAAPRSSAESEAALGLDPLAVRDLQARLLVLGHDPNGIDGKIGPGTRAAVSAWQVSQGVEPTGYLSAELLGSLKRESQAALDTWLEDEANAKLHSPPPPIAITPALFAGNWSFSTTCGSRSRLGEMKITGYFSINQVRGETFAGKVKNSQGLVGDLSGRVSGRNFTGEVNWGLFFGRVRIEGRVADYELVVNGRDSNGCRFHAAKS
jgi:hypothetical protein